MSYKLFIPGPIEVAPETYAAMTTPVFGHRSNDFVEFYASLQPRLQKLFYTKDPVYISTSSSWGVMEGAVRNVCGKKVLNCMNGAFSDKWYDVSLRCGKKADKLQVEWGCAIKPEMVREKLATGEFDAITLIHNETSTGTMSPLKEIMDVVREFPDVISIVDCVSSFSVVPILKDEWGIDVLVTGCQKALALPPGMSFASVSARALERSKSIPDRGYYFDFVEFHENWLKHMTPSTPCISLMFGLRQILDVIEKEGIENRYARHARLNKMVSDWATKEGFELFPEKGCESKALSCIKNTRNIDVAAMNKTLKSRYKAVIDGGYGKIKGKTFRISNMGNETDKTIGDLLGQLSEIIKEIA